MKNVVIITNIPSPYRVSLFESIRCYYKEYKITVVYQDRTEPDRSWIVNEDMLKDDIFLKALSFNCRENFGKKIVRIPMGLNKTLGMLRPDVVVIAEYNPVAIIAAMWCRRHKVKYISWTDGTRQFERGIGKAQILARKYIIGHAAAFLASSTRAKENQIFYHADPDRVFTSMLTIDTKNFYYEKKQFHNKKILYVGRLTEIKGVDLLLRALAKVKANDYILYIVGDGTEEDNLKKLAMQSGIADKVVFQGFHEGDSLIAFYRECDIFVLPSRNEAFGLVILEAMCSSMPVVCSSYAQGAYDLIEEGVNGFCVDPYQADDFAKTMEALLEDVHMVEDMGKKSYEKSKNYSIEKSASVFMEAINEVI